MYYKNGLKVMKVNKKEELKKKIKIKISFSEIENKMEE